MEQEMKQRVSTFSLTCYLKKTNLLKNGEAPVYMRITVSGQVANISLQGSISPLLWNQAKEQSKGTDRKSQELNHYIESVRSRLYKIHRELEIDGKPITASIIKDRYMGKTEEQEGRTLNEVHTEHNERCRRLLGIEYSKSTIYKFDTSLKYLKEFMSTEMSIEDISLKEINENFIRKYELYLKTEKSCANNSAIKHLKIFKKIIRIALLNDWLQKDPFASVKFKQDEVHVEFLTMYELNNLITKEMPCKRLEQVRDVFAFCCFTGLAFVDIKGLQAEHIIHGNDGEMWIRKPRVKTNNMCNIPLLKIPRMLLEKYSNDKGCGLRGQLLPVPTNQKMNAYLKEVTDICGINKRLTTHVARHSFATSVTLANKVTMENVAKMLGHSSTRMTQHYAKVLDQSILEDMMNVDNKLFANL
ncbi:MAG: site-specific integrase [Prevotella sp.]|jgi:site-specific recombinase XerD|nr:site-specific integrase [Prevotella sp.]